MKRLVGKAKIFVVMIAAVPLQEGGAKAQQKETGHSVYTSAQDYATWANDFIDKFNALKNIPGASDKLRNPLLDPIGEELKRLNDSRAEAERTMNNGQMPNLPDIPTEPEAFLSPKDVEFVKSLAKPNYKLCNPDSSKAIQCNGAIKPYTTIECSVGVPDSRIPTGWRAIGVYDIQCVPEDGTSRLSGHIVAVIANNLMEYHYHHKGRYVTVADIPGGKLFVYKGANYAAFCVPCPENRRTKANQCTGIPALFGLCKQ